MPSMCFAYINSFSPYNKTMTEETEAETSSDFSKVKQQVNGKAEI